MKRILFTIPIVLVAISCDLLFNKDSGSGQPANDIEITNLELATPVTQGEVVDIAVTVKNNGIADVADSITVSLIDQTEDTLVGTQVLPAGLAQSDSLMLEYSWDTSVYSTGDHDIAAVHDFTDSNTDNNSRIQKVTINESQMADIAITSLDAPMSATQGDDVNVSVTVRNLGNLDTSDDFNITLSDQTDSNQLATQTITGGMASGNTVVFSFIWDAEGASIGAHTLSAAHDFEDEPPGNDSRTAEIDISETPVTDMAVAEIGAPSQSIQGDTVSISVTLENQGNQDINEALTVSLTDETDGVTISSQTLDEGLSAGESGVLTFSWDTGASSIGGHTLVAAQNFEDDNQGNDTRSVNIFVEEPPFIDFAITSVSGPSSASQGDDVVVSVQLQNLGNRDIGDDIDITLTDDTDGMTIGSQTISGGLDEGDSITRNFTWNTKSASLGDHTLTATHNLDDDDGSNNSNTTDITINEPPFFDIAITEVEAPEDASRGDEVDVEVTIENLGNRDVNDTISVTLSDQTDETTIGTQVISGGLEEADSIVLTFVWDTRGYSLGDHTLVVNHDYNDDDSNNDSAQTDVYLTFF